MNCAPLVAASVLAWSGTAIAQSTFSGSVSLASNHLQRGISRSSHDPSLAAEVQLQSGQGWFASAWAATSRARDWDDTAVDIAATAGFGSLLGENWSWRGSVAHYRSPWQEWASWYRYNELTVDLQYRDALLLSASWSPDTVGYLLHSGVTPRADALAFEASAQRSLLRAWRGHAGVGYRAFAGELDRHYWYGSVGTVWTASRWEADLSYVHPARAARALAWPGNADRKLVMRVTVNF